MNTPAHIVVTGGAGFIGSHLVERLITDGNSVTVIDDCSTGSLGNLRDLTSRGELGIKLRVIQAKVSDCAELRDAVRGAAFIYHLAAAVGVELVVRSPVKTIETNLHETEVILKAAAKFGVPVLLASTSEVYGKSRQSAFDEEDDLVIGPPHLGRWSYACSKLMDEFLALAYAKERGLRAIIVRLFNTVGPRQTGRYGMVLPRFIAAAKAGTPLPVYGDGSQTRCFCFVKDTVEAMVRLQNNSNAFGEVFNIGSTEEIKIRELAERVVAILGSQSSIEFIPYNKAYEVGFEDMLRRKPIVEKLFQTTGFKPATSLREIIESTAGGQ